MANPFFVALGDRNGTLEEAASRGLEPFRHYLQNAINASRNRQVSCRWKPLDAQQWRLSIEAEVYRVHPFSEVELLLSEPGWYAITRDLVEDIPLDDSFALDPDDPVIVGKGRDRQNIRLTVADVRQRAGEVQVRLGEGLDLDRISWCGYALGVRSLDVALDSELKLDIDGRTRRASRVEGSRYRIDGAVEPTSELTCEGQRLAFRVLKSFDPASLGSPDLYRREGESYLLFAEREPKGILGRVEPETQRWYQGLGASHLSVDGAPLQEQHWKCESVPDKGRLYLQLTALEAGAPSLPGQVSLTAQPNVTLSCNRIESRDKWIQLIEDDEADDQQAGQSSLEYFFGDNIRILDSKAKRGDEGYSIIKARPDECQLLLRRGKGKGGNSVFPTQDQLQVQVDTSQLEKQKQAIQSLQRDPALAHASLIRLFEHRERTRWPEVEAVPEVDINWQVLTDITFDGCDRQREFVSKALATPDFAILDGPPGTGKTTTILELIVQLVRRGQRVLLSASTHAAINNVLERIQRDRVLAAEVFPLRIGDENRAVGVEAMQYDNQLKELRDQTGFEVSEQLLVDASNLVCGTTIGILRLFRNRALGLEAGEPPFDVLIVDECSKTTFQEFLVPARYARRWVLVGDERQLSPFAEREQITANLDQLMLKPGKSKEPAVLLDPAIQKACFYLQEFHPYRDRLIVPVSLPVLRALGAELQHRDPKAHEEILLLGPKQQGVNMPGCWLTPERCSEEPYHLYAHNLIFIEEGLLPELRDRLPDDAILLHPDWQESGHAFRHRAGWANRHQFRLRGREVLNDGFEVHQKVSDRLGSTGWSDEVCWRLEREYWLRFLKGNKHAYLKEQLDRLLPKSVQADGRIYTLRNIAFPSILEALSGDGLEKKRKDEPTTLNQGFQPAERQQRHSTLSHQHRMHPDISRFPRDEFYSHDRRNRSLLDGSQVASARAWDYNAYPSRSHWLHVSGKVVRNRNEKEVKAVIAELDRFCGWAARQDKTYDVAVLTFYKGQESALREALQKLPGNAKAYSRFTYKGVAIKLATVDFFQGQEADLVILSMVNTHRDGFMDSPNRLNVSITRARYQLLIVGDRDYFAKRSRTQELKALAQACSFQGTHE